MLTVRKQRLILKVLRRVGVAIIPISIMLWQIYREMVPTQCMAVTCMGISIGDHINYPVDISVSSRGTDAYRPIWVHLEITVLPKRFFQNPLNPIPPEPLSNYPWIATRFSKPFSSQFRRADGTLTDVLPIDWGSGNSILSWSEDGQGFLSSYMQVGFPPIAPGERWLYSRMPLVFSRAALRAVWWSVVPIILIVVLTVESRWVNAWWGRCENCDYNLTKTEGNACPECGEPRVNNGRQE